MDERGAMMYKIDMETGHTSVTWGEKRMQHFGVQVLVTQQTTVTPDGWALELRSPFWRFYTTDKQGAFVIWSGRRFELYPKRVYLVPAWAPFTTGTARAVGHGYVHFLVSGFPEAWLKESFDRPVGLPRAGALGALVERWMEAMQMEQDRRSLLATYGWAGVLAQAAVIEAVEGLPEGPRKRLREWIETDQALRAALDRLDADPAARVDNAELAGIAGMGVDHFIRRFKAATGLTPAQYRIERRVLTASRWLAGTERKLDDIAEAAGFTDRFYFTRIFKERLGLTPREFRRMHRLERAD
jgi:AraC-like DNA-binding protein